jgi:hypothetical protein
MTTLKSIHRALLVLITATTACAAESSGGVAVEYDGAPFPATKTHAALSTGGDPRTLSVTITDPGSDAIDDEEWFTLTVELDPEAIAAGTTLRIDGSSTLVDRVEGENGYPQAQDLSFDAQPDHDPRVLRGWLWHHAWFHGWGGDQHQQISGEIAIEAIDADGTLHGSVELEVHGNMPPVSAESDHDATLSGEFRTDSRD